MCSVVSATQSADGSTFAKKTDGLEPEGAFDMERSCGRHDGACNMAPGFSILFLHSQLVFPGLPTPETE